MPIESVMPSNHLIFCHPLLLLPSVFSRMRVWFKMSRLFTSGGQSIGASASASALLMNIQSWHPVGLTGLISYCPRDSQESSPTPQFKGTNSLAFSLLYGPTLTSIMTTGKTIALTRQTFWTSRKKTVNKSHLADPYPEKYPLYKCRRPPSFTSSWSLQICLMVAKPINIIKWQSIFIKLCTQDSILSIVQVLIHLLLTTILWDGFISIL